MIIRMIAAAMLLALCGSSNVLAAPATTQSSTGTIVGSVVDPQGHPAKDCIVTLQQNAQKMREPLQTTTDDKGEFTFENVPEGTYNLNIRTRDVKGRAIKTLEVFAGMTSKAGKLKLKMK